MSTGFFEVNRSEYKDLYRQLKATYRMAAMRAAMHNADPASIPLPAAPNSLEGHFSALFKTLPPGLRPMAGKFSFEGHRLFGSNQAVLQNRLGTLSKIKFVGDSLAKQVADNHLLRVVRVTSISKSMQTNYNFANFSKWLDSLNLGKSAGAPQPPATTTYTRLRFKLASLKCEDETDWDLGDASISMGGMAIDSSAPQVKNLQEFQIKTDAGQDFTNGRRKR